MHIGPQPSTDCFNVYSYGQNTSMSSEVALSNPKYPFAGLLSHKKPLYGRFNIHEINNSMLKKVHICDTPGILDNDDNSERGYDLVKVIIDLADVAEQIIILVDAQRASVSQNLKRLIGPITKYHHYKTVTVINKSHDLEVVDSINLFMSTAWHFSKSVESPEMIKFIVCSFIEPIPQRPLSKVISANHVKFKDCFQNLTRRLAYSTMNNMVKRLHALKVIRA